jgi:hypothetical protein
MTATATSAAAVPQPSARDGCWLIPLLGLVLALRVAVMLASGAGLHVDEAQYWDWSRELQWGYFSKPPLTSVLIAASTAVLGDGLLGVRLWAMACWLLASLVLWRLGVAAGSASGGVWAAVLLAATPASGLLGLVATTDAPLMLAWTLCLAATWHALQGGARATGCWLLAGLALGLGLQAKYTMAVAGLSWLWLLLARRDAATARGVALASLVALLVFSPNLGWNAVHHWPTLRHTAEITEVAEAAAGAHSAWHGLGEFLGAQLLLAGPVFWIVAVAVALRRRGLPRGLARAPWAFALAFVLPLVVVGALQSLRGPLQLNWTAPVLPGLCLLLGLAAARVGLSRTPAVAALCASAVLYGGISLAGEIWRGRAPERAVLGQGTPAWDIWARMRGWDPLLDALRPLVQAHPQALLAADGRDLLAHARYAWRDLGLRPWSWDAADPPRHHYDMVQGLSVLKLAPPQRPAQVLLLAHALSASARMAYGRCERLWSGRLRHQPVALWLLEQPLLDAATRSETEPAACKEDPS